MVVDPNPPVIERYLVIVDVEMSSAGGDFADFDPTTLQLFVSVCRSGAAREAVGISSVV